MPAIDIFKRGEADGTLSKFTVKADAGDDSAFRFEADVAFVISGPEDAKVLEADVPGAMTAYEKAMNPDDNWKWSVTVKPSISASCELSNAAKGLSAVKGLAEIRSVTVRASKKVMTAVVRLAFGGQPPEVAASLTKLLRNATTLSIEPQQQGLPFKRADVRPAIEKGDIVVARLDDGEEVVGRATGEPEDVDGVETLTLDDLGIEHIVPVEKVVSVVGINETSSGLLADYKRRAKRARVKPTLAAILGALLANGTADGRVYQITESTVEAALQWQPDSGATGEAQGQA